MDKHPFRRAIDALFPGRCLCCGLASGRPLDLCRGCESELIVLGSHCSRCAEPLPSSGVCGLCQQKPPAFHTIVSPYLYLPPLDHLITRLKHGGDLCAGEVLGTLLARHVLTRQKLHPDYLVPMPLHWRRRWKRGFNQAREIACALSRKTGIPLAEELLQRTLHSPAQQSANRQARLTNVRGAFTAKDECRGLYLAVIDDVVTSTATARTAAAALADHGALRIDIWCVARTPLEK